LWNNPDAEHFFLDSGVEGILIWGLFKILELDPVFISLLWDSYPNKTGGGDSYLNRARRVQKMNLRSKSETGQEHSDVGRPPFLNPQAPSGPEGTPKLITFGDGGPGRGSLVARDGTGSHDTSLCLPQGTQASLVTGGGPATCQQSGDGP